MKNIKLLVLVFVLVAVTSIVVNAATMSASLTPPAVDDADIANLAGAVGSDKWWAENSPAGTAKGQTFTTGGEPVWLNSISYQITGGNKAEPTKNYVIRLCTVYGSVLTEIYRETATQDFTWNPNEFMTWTFDRPVLLAPDTIYGIDLGLTSSTSGWSTGIPYIQTTDNNYSGGTRYTSGTGMGIADANMANTTGDMIFHLDMTTAAEGMPGYYWPQNGQTILGGNIDLIWNNLVPNTGSDTYVDVWYAEPNSPLVKVVDAGQNTTTVNVDVLADGRYYWQINSYLNGNPSGQPAEGMLSTFYVNASAEPDTIQALTALKDHVLGNVSLSADDIAACKSTIDINKSLFGTTEGVITAALDLVETFDASGVGPLWINSYPSRDSEDNIKNDLPGTMFFVMQNIIDITYASQNLVKFETLLDGFIFGSSQRFPGHVDPPSTIETHTATINASYPDTAGWERQQDTLPARKPTGTYLAPGTFVTVTVPQELVGKGYMVRVGAHSWDLSHRPPVKRLWRSSLVYPIDSTTIKVANPLGGGIYIEVPFRADNGVVSVDITGAVRSPFYSNNTVTGHITTLSEWQNVERHHPAPWADFQTEKYMTQVPTTYIYNLDDPQTAMADWDKAIDVMNDLMGFPRDRGKETVYTQVDVIMRSGVHAPGYPAVNTTNGNPTAEITPLGNTGSYLIHGPRAAAATEIHEQGHAYFFPKFGGESEANVNLPHVAIMNLAFGYDLDYSFAASRGYGGNPHRTLNNTAIAWMTSFNFSPREVEMHTAEKAYQLKGHAKFVDIAKMFGWQVLNDYWKSFVDDYENGLGTSTSDDEKLVRLSKCAGFDIRPLFHFWGIHPTDPNAVKTAIENEGLMPSLGIYNRLLEYKSILPDNNDEFRTFAFNWWGREPSINGNWTETEHARQLDTRMRREADILDQQRPELTEGEMYVEAVAADIREYIDRIIAMYFPDGSPAYSVQLDDMVSWSGAPIVLDPNIVNSGGGDLSYSWSIVPQDGVSYEALDIENPVITITKPAGEMVVYSVSLMIEDGVNTPAADSMTVEVYDDACQATRLGLGITDSADLNKDCVVNLGDLAVMAEKWLDISGMDTPQHKLPEE